MPISAAIVGSQLPSRTVQVTPRMMLAYAAGIGERSRVCLDDSRADFIAHPALCTRFEWLLVSEGRASVMGATPEEMLRAVHAGQSSRFWAPIRAGEDVTVTGRIVEVSAARAGARVRTELELFNARTGAKLTSTLSTSVYRGVPVVDARHSLPSPDTGAAAFPGGEAECVRVELDRGFPHIYSECAEIWNPIHTEVKVARAAQLPDIIVHGTAVWAIAARELIARYAPGEPQKLAWLDGRFSAMVIAGDPITIRHGAGADPGSVWFSVLNVAGQEAISRGAARFTP